GLWSLAVQVRILGAERLPPPGGRTSRLPPGCRDGRVAPRSTHRARVRCTPGGPVAEGSPADRRESALTTAHAAAVVVLAAGEGTRMRSATPKVLHTMGGRSLLGHALAAATDLEPERVCVVVRHDRDRVAAHARELLPSVLVADQDEIPGTGRAVRCALAVLDGAADADAARQGRTPSGEGGLEGPVVVMAGDVPLLDGGTLRELLEAHVADRNAVTVLTTRVDDPTGYGRIVRDGSGQVAR